MAKELNKIKSFNLYTETELPGKLYPLETHDVIKARYYLAGKLAEGRDVLEIGCGSGIGISYLSEKSANYTGGEFSDENLVFIRKKYGAQGKVKKVDAHNMPFADGSFDVVVALAMIYYLNMKIFLYEVRRVLRPGGILFFCMSNPDVPGFVPAPFTTKYYSIPEISELLSNAQFKAHFQGAFPASGGSLFCRRIRAGCKNFAKFLVQAFPGGKHLWKDFRRHFQGEMAPLPETLGEIHFDHEKYFVSLCDDKIDKRYRIIYATAKKL